MATREFNGTSDYIILGGTGASIGDGAWSVIAVVKPTATSSSGAYVSCARTTSNSPVFEMHDGSSANVLAHNNYSDGTVSATLAPKYVASSWQIIGVSKPAGAGDVTARFHCSVVDSGSWAHANAAVGLGGHPTDAWTQTQIGRRGTGTNFKSMRIAVAAVFNTYLSDANYESITTTTQSIANLGAIALWEFNQASTATTVSDLIGTANETSKSGTSTAADDPTWTYGLEQTIRSQFLDYDYSR